MWSVLGAVKITPPPPSINHLTVVGILKTIGFVCDCGKGEACSTSEWNFKINSFQLFSFRKWWFCITENFVKQSHLYNKNANEVSSIFWNSKWKNLVGHPILDHLNSSIILTLSDLHKNEPTSYFAGLLGLNIRRLPHTLYTVKKKFQHFWKLF